jgi:HdeA/HdeB family
LAWTLRARAVDAVGAEKISGGKMRQFLFAAAAVTVGFASGAIAQTATPLSTYADKDGYLDVQALSCAQLAGTYQEDANYLTSWYSGWYNGLAKKHYANIPRAKEAEHETIVYCKEHPDEKVIKVIGRVIDEYREKKGIEVNK